MESVTVRKVVSLEHALRFALPIIRREAKERDTDDSQAWLLLYEQAAELLTKEAGS